MKTVEELYKEILGSDELKEKFIAAAKENTLTDFLKENDCAASVKDVMEYLRGARERALSGDDLKKVAGGGSTCEEFCAGTERLTDAYTCTNDCWSLICQTFNMCDPA